MQLPLVGPSFLMTDHGSFSGRSAVALGVGGPISPSIKQEYLPYLRCIEKAEHIITGISSL